MALVYRFNVLDALKAKGYTTYRLRKERVLSESTIQKLRAGLPIAWENLDALCRLLDCQPGEIIEYKEDGS